MKGICSRCAPPPDRSPLLSLSSMCRSGIIAAAAVGIAASLPSGTCLIWMALYRPITNRDLRVCTKKYEVDANHYRTESWRSYPANSRYITAVAYNGDPLLINVLLTPDRSERPAGGISPGGYDLERRTRPPSRRGLRNEAWTPTCAVPSNRGRDIGAS